MRKIFILFVAIFLFGCDNIDFNPKSEGTGIPLWPEKLGLSDEFIGDWGETSMTLQDGEPFAIPLKEALLIERSARNEDGSLRLNYEIMIEELRIEASRISRYKTLRVPGKVRSQLIWSSVYRVEDDHRLVFVDDVGIDEVRVLAVEEGSIQVKIMASGSSSLNTQQKTLGRVEDTPEAL